VNARTVNVVTLLRQSAEGESRGLWAGATPKERRKLLLAMLDAVYVDAKEEKRIVGIKPKPPFRPIFQVATTKEGSGVVLMKEPPDSGPEAPCFWWRRGRVELPVQRKLPDWLYRFSRLFSLTPLVEANSTLGGPAVFFFGAPYRRGGLRTSAFGAPPQSLRGAGGDVAT